MDCKLFELTQVVRQKDDNRFTSLLNRLHIRECTEEDLQVLESRQIHSSENEYFDNVLHVYRTNNSVDERNMLMLNKLAETGNQFIINAQDSQSGVSNITGTYNRNPKQTDTGGLHSILKVAIGALVMLTINVDATDGLDDKIIKLIRCTFEPLIWLVTKTLQIQTEKL